MDEFSLLQNRFFPNASIWNRETRKKKRWKKFSFCPTDRWEKHKLNVEHRSIRKHLVEKQNYRDDSLFYDTFQPTIRQRTAFHLELRKKFSRFQMKKNFCFSFFIYRITFRKERRQPTTNRLLFRKLLSMFEILIFPDLCSPAYQRPCHSEPDRPERNSDFVFFVFISFDFTLSILTQVPKSANFKCPLMSNNMLSGLISLEKNSSP